MISKNAWMQEIFEILPPSATAICTPFIKRFVVVRDTLGGVAIDTYFFREDAHHSSRFIEAAKRYLPLYPYCPL
jgi:hypothetical protein